MERKAVAAIIFAASLFVIPFCLGWLFGMPSVLSEYDPRVLKGERPSGAFGYKALIEITKESHPYNSDENLRVAEYLKGMLNQVKDDYDTWTCEEPNRILVNE